MADINHVVLVGRLTRDAELKYTTNGQAVCNFSLAINRRRKNGDQWEDEVSYFDVVLWGRQGEAVNQFLKKGKQVGIEGELRQDKWQQDGQTRYKVNIVANNIQLLGGGSPGESQSSGSYDSGQGFTPNRGGQSAPPPADDGFADDIPF